ncbi:hypothetical protein FRC18_002265 [Serendipita sp. 400]|nr:hypothetical protein FRC18_002265 [Serendipita sp. 400]
MTLSEMAEHTGEFGDCPLEGLIILERDIFLIGDEHNKAGLRPWLLLVVAVGAASKGIGSSLFQPIITGP